jgi:glycosyltransferase involved in cell wall biosynthesis
MPGADEIRVLFINHWARRLGGAEHSLLDLLEETAFHNDAYLVCAEEGELMSRARALGVVCTPIPCSSALGNVRRDGMIINLFRQWRGLLSFLGFVLRVRRFVEQTMPGLIHANVPKSHITLFLLRLLGYRGICCFHIREIFENASAPFRLYSLLFRPHRSLVIAISGAVKASLPPALAKHAHVVYNGVTIAPARTYDGTKNSPPRFVYLGRVVPWKGCHQLVKTFARLHARHGDRAGTLDVIGDTLYWEQTYRAEVQAIIDSKGMGAVCRLLPHTGDPLDALSRYDVFCIASIREPFGRVVAEAQGCGMPVVAFDDGGIVEIVEQNVTGTLVRAGDVEGFARAMAHFIDDPGLIERMGTAARERAARLFERTAQRKKIVAFMERGAGTGGVRNTGRGAV